jgi:hypothetical protein
LINGGIETCDEYKNAATPPSYTVLNLYYLSGPLIPFCIGLTFGFDKKHVRVLALRIAIATISTKQHATIISITTIASCRYRRLAIVGVVERLACPRLRPSQLKS